MAAHLAARSHRWCRYWDGSVQKQLEPLVESGPMLVSPWLLHQAETSGRQIGAGLRPRLYRQHPSRLRPASRRRGSARWSGRSRVNLLRAAMLGTLWKEVNAKGVAIGAGKSG